MNTGFEKAKEVVAKIKEQSAVEKREKESIISRSLPTPVISSKDIRGMEDVRMNVPFYKLVQPGSTNIQLADATDAPAGTIFLSTSKQAVKTLEFALLSTRIQKRKVVNKKGEAKVIISRAILGINPESYSPFILTAPLSSFSAVGKLKNQMRDRQAVTAWDYPVTVTTEKREEQKETDEGLKTVKYYVLNFSLGETPFSEDEKALMTEAFAEFANVLENETEENEAEPARPLRVSEEVRDEVLGDEVPF